MIDLRKWADWSPWEAMDSGMEKTYSGAESGVGSRYAWSGNRKVGQGNMEIVGATPNEKVEIALEFITPFKASNATALAFTEEAGGTRVRWTMTGKSTLILRIMGIFRKHGHDDRARLREGARTAQGRGRSVPNPSRRPDPIRRAGSPTIARSAPCAAPGEGSSVALWNSLPELRRGRRPPPARTARRAGALPARPHLPQARR